MPQPVETITEHQPSFTSSIYQAIASESPLLLNSNRPLNEQPNIQAFLHASLKGPISEIVLYRLLTITELYLKQRFPDKQLTGLCVGYILRTEKKPEFYYVSWGWIPDYSKKIENWIRAEAINPATGEATAMEELSAADEALLQNLDNSEELIEAELTKLAGLIEEELRHQVYDSLFPGQQIKVFLLSHYIPVQRTSANLFQNSLDKNFNQFSVSLQPSNDFQFDPNGVACIALNRDIEPNPNIRFTFTPDSFNFAVRSSSICAAEPCSGISHKHRDGRCYTTPPGETCPTGCNPV